MHDFCLDPIKNQAPKYLRLPNVIFNDIGLMLTVGTGKGSSIYPLSKSEFLSINFNWPKLETLRFVMKSKATKVFLFLLLPMAILLMLNGVSAGQESKPPKDSPPAEEKPTSEQSLADLAPLASKLADRFIDLEKDIEAGIDLSAAKESLGEIIRSQDDIHSTVEKLKTSKKYGVARLEKLKGAIQSQEDSVKRLTESLNEAVSQLGVSLKSWSEDKEKWSEFRSSLPKDVLLSTVKPAFSKANQSIERALNLINRRMKPLLAVQQEAGEIQTRFYKLETEVDALLLATRGYVFSQSAPPMFTPDYFSEFDRRLWGDLRIVPHTVPWPERQFYSQNAWVIIFQGLFALVFSLGILRHRQFLEETERWRFLAKRPFAAGLLLVIPTLMWLYKPVSAILALACLTVGSIALARLAGVLIAIIWKRRLVYGLVLLLITIDLFRLMGLPLPAFRLYIFFVSLIGMPLSIWRSVASSRRGDSALYTWTLRLGACVFGLCLAAELGGYSEFASRLLVSSLKTIFIILTAWVVMLLARGALELAVNSRLFQKVQFLKSRTNFIANRMAFIANILIAVVCFSFILYLWGLFESHIEAMRGVFSLGFNVGSLRISTGLVITTAAILFGSFIVSWAIQATLLDSAFSGRDIDTGIQFSVAKLVHYAIILVGFLLALAALGVDLKNVTIIGGALGIGIGFGLQTIVNNFACGLILLFERPIKIGDYIEYNNDWAEIKKIGLRSTIVQTFDRADIIVPNSTLITNDIINWTHSDRFARIRLPIKVAYGSDVPQVMKIVLECAEETPSIMRAPAPKIYFLEFGESSLDFELRVHLSEIDEWYPARTALLQEIERRFREAGIQIPFPQRDVHVQSAGEAPTATLTPPKDQLPGQMASSNKESGEGD
jgi:potassium efflux system protein